MIKTHLPSFHVIQNSEHYFTLFLTAAEFGRNFRKNKTVLMDHSRVMFLDNVHVFRVCFNILFHTNGTMMSEY